MRLLAQVVAPQATNRPSSRSIEIANRAADGFVRVYYSAYDSDTRATDVPKFYRQDSTLTWNGTALQGAEGMHQLLQGMPPTQHEMQSFDCHPIPSMCDSPLRGLLKLNFIL